MKQNEGVKLDTGKPQMDLLQFQAIEQVAAVASFGARKYESHGWRKGFKYGRLFAAALRHMFVWARGIDNDDESGLSHLAHAAWNLLSLLEFVQTKTGIDDRFIYPTEPEEPKPPETSDNHP